MPRSNTPLFGFALALMFSVGQLASAQSVAVVDSNDPDAHVYADSTWLGLASLQSFVVPPGTSSIRVVPKNVGVWGLATIRVEVPLRLDTLHVQAQFPYSYRLDATPVGADVYRIQDGERTYLGATPQISTFDTPMHGTLHFEKPGFATVEISPGDAIWNRHLVVMRPLSDAGATHANIQLDMPARSRRWIDYVSVGAAIAGGLLAVHYKTKADHRFNVYQETGNPDLRPEIERFDDRSAFALGAMQAGVGVFALRLALR